jgi:hypothetical protein
MKGTDLMLLLVVLGLGALGVWYFLLRGKSAHAGGISTHRSTLSTLANQGRGTITAGELASITGNPTVLPPNQILRTEKPAPKRSVFGL